MVCLSTEGHLRRRIKLRTDNEYILKLITNYKVSEKTLRYILECLPKHEAQVSDQARDILNDKVDFF